MSSPQPAASADHRSGPPPGLCDVVVVGAGVGGCVVASRLAAAGRRVVLAEAGPGEPRPSSVAGIDVVAASQEPTRAWAELTVRRTSASAPRPYRQGKGLGGGSMINGMLLTPGDTADYRRWGQRLGPDWGPEMMAPWLARATAMFDGSSIPPGPVTEAFAESAAQLGHAVGGVSTEPDRLGLVTARLAASAQRRRSAAEATGVIDVTSGRRADGIELVTECPASAVEFEGERATGVRWADGSFTAASTVVVCAGAIATPGLIAVSDLPSTVNRAAVGDGLKDHPSVALTAIIDGPTAGGAGAAVSRLLRWSSHPDELGDLQAFVLEPVNPGDGGGPTMAVLVVGLMTVRSAGRVGRGDGHGRPDVVTGALDHAEDRRRLRLGLRHLGELVRQPVFGAAVDRVVIDERGTAADELWQMGDDELDRWMAVNPGPYAHPAATCRLGRPGTSAAVVSCLGGEIGRVIGTDNLFLADASILPDLVQGGLQLPVAAVAARVADDLISSDVG